MPEDVPPSLRLGPRGCRPTVEKWARLHVGGGSMQPGLGVSRLLPAGLWQELFIAECDRCGGVARVGVGVAVANEVTEIRQTEG